MTTVGEALRQAARRLEATSSTSRLDAELLMAEVLAVSRSDVLLKRMGDPAPDRFEALIERRATHEPVAYILGRKEFYGRPFAVGPGVLIPRMDSETTVAAALDACPAPHRVLDCGVGSGALLLTVLAERPGSRGIGIDRSPAAIAIARGNAEALGVARSCEFRVADWSQRGWAEDLGRFDLVLANPPYVEQEARIEPDVRGWEPPGALFAGADGLDAFRVLIPQLPDLLEAAGVAVVEIGATQEEAVMRLAEAAGFTGNRRHDLGGRPRAVILRLGLGR